MAAAVSDPSGSRLSALTTTDEGNLSWLMERAEGDVGGLHSANLVRGGTCSTVDYDKMTVRQRNAATRQRGILAIRSMMSLDLWLTLTRYWSPECARVRVERARGKPGSEDSLAPLGVADREIRLVSLYPYTTAAQVAGEALVFAERLRERARRVKASPLRLVGAREEAWGADVVANVAAGANLVQATLNADAFAREETRRRIQGEWVPRPLASDELRDAAVRAIREAERRKDLVLLAAIRVEAAQTYALAQDAYVRARRAVKGKDGEEKRRESVDRYVRTQSCVRTQGLFEDLAARTSASSR